MCLKRSERIHSPVFNIKKVALLLIIIFIFLPIVYTYSKTSAIDDDMERIFRENSRENGASEEVQEDWDTKIIKVVPDGTGHLLVDVVLNGDVHARLTIDTGAPDVCLTADIARKLGFDLGNMKNIGESMVLNGKHKVAYVRLKSLNLGGAEQENVPAAVFLEDDREISNALNDGLLGLSFLSKFNFTLDKRNSRLILKKVQ